MDRQSGRGPEEPGLDPRTLRDPLYSSDASIPACRHNCATAKEEVEVERGIYRKQSVEQHSGKQEGSDCKHYIPVGNLKEVGHQT